MPGLRLAWSWTRNVNTGGLMLYYIANNQIIGSFFSRQEVFCCIERSGRCGSPPTTSRSSADKALSDATARVSRHAAAQNRGEA